MITMACALLSGAMYYFAYGLDDVWMLAWIAPAPLLWLAWRDASRWQVMAAALFTTTLGTIYIFQAYGTYVLIDGIVMAIANGLLLGAALLLAQRARHVLPAAAAVFVFPVVWTAIEFAEGWISPHGAWGALGYTQVHWPAAIQVAALAGVYGVTFILCLFASAVSLALSGERRAGVIGAAVALAVVAGGYARIALSASTSLPTSLSAPLRVAAISIVTPNGQAHAKAQDVAQQYAAAIRAEAARGVKVVVTPETSIESDALDPIQSAARDTGTVVVAGTHNRTPQRNMAVAFVPGQPALTYDKRHLLLPGEAVFMPGSRSGIIGNGIATAICKDLDFPRTIRGDAQSGIRLMIVPANDFSLDGWIHARQAVMRGVENGFAVLRVASHGLATVSDDRGRVLTLAQVGPPGTTVARADVPLGTGPTLYTRLGDWFAWLCIALAVGTLILARVAGARTRKGAAVGAMRNAA
jgi:apolipoprotein N-acyltransferase